MTRERLDAELEGMADMVQLAGGPATVIASHLHDLAELLPKVTTRESVIITIVYTPDVGLALALAGDHIPDDAGLRDQVIGPICQAVADMIASNIPPVMEYTERVIDEDAD